MKLQTELKQVLNRSFRPDTEAAADEKLRQSLERNIKDNVDEVSAKVTGVLDALLMENPQFLRSFNRKLANTYGKDVQLNYSGVTTTDDGTRALTTGNSTCEVVSCSDIMLKLYDCDFGIENYISLKTTPGTCPEQFPSYVGKPMAGVIAENAAPPDMSDAFVNATPVTPNNFLACTTLDPKQIALKVEISRKRLRCKNCIDILALVMEEAPKAIKRRIRKSIYDLLGAQATNLTAVSSNIRSVLRRNQSTLVRVPALTLAGASTFSKVNLSQIYHIMDQVTFNAFFYDEDANGRPINTDVSTCVPSTCKAYCIHGMNVIVDAEMPLGVTAAGVYTTKVYSGDLKAIAARQSTPEMAENLINNSIVEGVKVEAITDYVDAIPVNMANMLVQRTVSFSVE